MFKTLMRIFKKQTVGDIVNGVKNYESTVQLYNDTVAKYRARNSDKEFNLDCEKLRLQQLIKTVEFEMNFIGTITTFIGIAIAIITTIFFTVAGIVENVEFAYITGSIYILFTIVCLIAFDKLKESHKKTIQYTEMCLKVIEDAIKGVIKL